MKFLHVTLKDFFFFLSISREGKKLYFTQMLVSGNSFEKILKFPKLSGEIIKLYHERCDSTDPITCWKLTS